jgi:hypothetical protein
MNRRNLLPLLAFGAAAIVCLAAGARPSAIGTTPIVERLVASAVGMNGSHMDREGRIDIVIERWSTDEERWNLRTHIDADRGPARLLNALQTIRRRVGFILSPGLQTTGSRARLRRAYNIEFAREIATPSGRRIVVAMDQHWGLGEPARDSRSSSSEFTLIDVRFGADGKGVGKVVPAEKVTFNPASMSYDVQDYAAQPVRLMDVRSGQGARTLNSTL